MSARAVLEARLFALQRVSAMLVAPFVLVHLGLMLYAAKGGLSAAEILERTRGSGGWAVFYGVFVVAVAVHAPIGVRNVLVEWTRLPRRGIDFVCALFALVLLGLGARAVFAVVAS
ncbi:MAG: succinate dehydrogenase [Burkholderiaceae bacterium]|nr:succinate dehydrogenase [Burkholderiaceae bacterium]